MAEIDKPLLARAIREWEQAAHRQKGQVLGEWLRVLGISRNAFYREVSEWGRMKERKPRRDRGNGRVRRLEEHVRRLWQVKHRPPPGQRLGSTEGALAYAVKNGIVPPELADVPVGSLNRLARELGLQAAPERQTRFQAAYANQVHQFDASHSEHFIPKRRDGDGWVLGMRRRRQKNKDKFEGLKLIAYGVCDDYSGLRLSRYLVAPGESALGSIEFLQWAWSYAEEHAPFEGWPDELYVDNGPLARHQAFEAFAARMGLTVTRHLPDKSRCTGKVENNWRSLWKRFETEYFFNPDWERFEISLAELNQEKAAFWKTWNQRRHRCLPVSRELAWHQSITQRGGVPRVLPDAWDTVFVEAERQIDAAGCFDFKGRTYQVDEIWACQAKIFCSITDGAIIVQNSRDGKRYRAKPFELRAWGDFRGAPKSELERLKEADDGKALKVPAPPSWVKEAGNVVVLPPRTAEVRESNFVLPEPGGHTGPPLQGLEELVAGVRVIERETAEGGCPTMEEPLAPTLEQYIDLKIKARARRLSPREANFVTWYEEAHAAMMEQFKGDIEMRVRLAAVE